MKASRHFAENQDAWVEAITKRRPDIDRKDATNLWASFKAAWAVNGLMNLDSYKKSADFFYQTGTLEKVPKIAVGEWAKHVSSTGFSKKSAPTRISIRPAGCCAS